MNNHQSLKAEIDAREENFAICTNLGKDLLARKHYASNEIKDKLVELGSRSVGGGEMPYGFYGVTLESGPKDVNFIMKFTSM